MALSSHIMYVDMNSFFASCEQQDKPHLRGKPVGVTAYDSPHATVIAPSVQAKKYGVKTGMRLSDCKLLCPEIIPIPAKASLYRKFHIQIIAILNRYCDHVIVKSIDEAALNFASYKFIYNDLHEIALKIKADLRDEVGECLTCSIGIAPNTFFAKLATDLKKPDGLIEINHDNVETTLKGLGLKDLCGIATRNERRLNMVGISSPLEMYKTSAQILRKAFGGVVGNYWHSRLHFKEVDEYVSDYKTMSAARTVSTAQRSSEKTLVLLITSLCLKLEQRMVQQGCFASKGIVFISYSYGAGWTKKMKFTMPLQDGIKLKRYIMYYIDQAQKERNTQMLSNSISKIGVEIFDLQKSEGLKYNLFDNEIMRDKARITYHAIKNKYGKNSVRRASEIIDKTVLKDAIGFGSVKDLDVHNGRFTDENKFNVALLDDYDDD